MTENEKALVSACADTMFTPDGAIPISGLDAGIIDFVAGYLAALPLKESRLIRVLFHFIQLGPLLFGPRRARFTRLAPSERLQVLRDMERGVAFPRLDHLPVFRRIAFMRRVAFLSMRAILSMGYFRDIRVTAAIMRRTQANGPGPAGITNAAGRSVL